MVLLEKHRWCCDNVEFQFRLTVWFESETTEVDCVTSPEAPSFGWWKKHFNVMIAMDKICKYFKALNQLII